MMKKKIFYQLFFIILTGIFHSCMTTKNPLKIIKSEKKITKVQMEIYSGKSLKDVEINNPNELDSLTQALKASTEKNVQRGGVFPTWADVKVYKGERVAVFSVLFSDYNGWYIEIDSRTFICDYMFNLVKKYSGSIMSE